MNSPETSSRLLEQKGVIRREAIARRALQPAKEATSAIIAELVFGLPQYQASRCLLLYLHSGSEVQTSDLVRRAWADGKKVVIPWCENDVRLRLVQYQTEADVAPGRFGIREPQFPLRSDPARQIEMAEVDLALLPVVAVDPSGARLGHGRGYFDRLLSAARPDTVLAGLAFHCQVFESLPMEKHDVFLNLVVTEKAVYRGRRG